MEDLINVIEQMTEILIQVPSEIIKQQKTPLEPHQIKNRIVDVIMLGKEAIEKARKLS